jgi:hypothetical protein
MVEKKKRSSTSARSQQPETALDWRSVLYHGQVATLPVRPSQPIETGETTETGETRKAA